MRKIKSWKLFEDLNRVLPIGTKIKFNGKDCEIVAHRPTMHNEIYYQIRYRDGFEEVIVPLDKRIELI